MMSDRECILSIIAAIGGDRDFWATTDTCRPSVEKAEAVLREQVASSKAFVSEWYAVRWERLRELIHDNALHIEDEACCIMANGTADHREPPTYAQLLNAKEHRLNAAAQERASLVALIGILYQHAEPSLRDPNIVDQVKCLLSEKGGTP